MKPIRIGRIAAAPGEAKRGYLKAFQLADGAKADIPTLVINGVRDGPVVNVHAAIHGDEYEGIEAAWKLGDRIKPGKLSGAVVVTPIVHLAAYGAGTRESPVDGKNLARVFPGDRTGTATDRLAYAFFNEVVLKCDYVIGLHSGGFRNRFHPLIEYYEGFDPEVGKKAKAAAQAFCVGPFDIMQRIGNPPRNVTCTSEASRHGIPGIEGEMWGEGRCVDEHSEQYAAATVSVLESLGMVGDDTLSAFRKEKRAKVRHCEGEWVAASNGGLFLPDVGFEDSVTKGQKVGVVKDETGQVIETVLASATGFIGAVHTFPMVRPGDGTVMIEKRVE
ncbi:MAG: succinylglutamate desuccinylase/aspartoacylase family protein [Nitrososphaerales archaeon]|jgi:predicted deacylase